MTTPTDQIIEVSAPKKPPKQVYFLTGTDTGVGKTWVGQLLLANARLQGARSFGLKPITAGFIDNADGKSSSEDAQLLMAQASVKVSEQLVAPIVLKEAIAPHLAAKHEGVVLNVSRIVGYVRAGLSTPASHILIEGAGGWRVPLNNQETFADLAKTLQLPVILVVGIRLGCINHAFLTVEAIMRDGLKLAGWVANMIDPDLLEAEEVIASIASRLSAPCLGVIPYAINPKDQVEIEHLSQCVRWPLDLPQA